MDVVRLVALVTEEEEPVRPDPRYRRHRSLALLDARFSGGDGRP